jgi:cobalamin-dependent methionine synthase I
MKLTINDKEVLRYLGYRSAEADERVYSLIAEMIDLFSENVVPKSVYGIWDCQIDSSTISLGGMNVKSKNLCEHLKDCRHAVLLAATLGTEADTMLRRFSVQDMEKAVIAQAVCAAMIEAYCDTVTAEIESELSQKEEPCLYPTARFSPGYGDFDISHQKDILNILNCSRIALTLTDGFMLIPSKSITAVIGFSKEKKHIMQRCESCAVSSCDFRKAV